jgi:hypothetical protein
MYLMPENGLKIEKIERNLKTCVKRFQKFYTFGFIFKKNHPTY